MNSILITGGSGFFGQAFTRRLLDSELSDRICIYSRDEWKQAQMRMKFNDDPRLRWFVGDVRDRDRLKRAMNGVDTVIHAAALKRIEVGAYNPTEMVKTNVLGTMNAVEAAADAGVKKFVFLSTDKAYQPASPYGHSKALAEKIVLTANDTYGANCPKYAVTRYGNVAGSTGSVIPIWRNILCVSDTVPVSDPEVTRFYMTIDEAVDLVLDTLNIMHGGELVIPKLPAYRLGDLAEAMDAKMFIRGLGKFEKLHEGMDEGNTSDKARRMSVEELREALKRV